MKLKDIYSKLPKDLEDKLESISFCDSDTSFELTFSYDIDEDSYTMLTTELYFNNNKLDEYSFEVKHYSRENGDLNHYTVYTEDYDLMTRIINLFKKV